MNIIEEIIRLSAIPMTPPKPYGLFHLIFFTVGFTLSILIARRLKNLSEGASRRLIFGVGLFLALCEIYKQLFYFYVIGNHSYQWWIFPFQMCSIPMYFCLIAPLLREGKLRRGMFDFMFSYNLLGGFISFFEPSGLIHDYLFLTLHAFVWHMSLIFLGVYLGFSGKAGCEKKDYKSATVTFLGLCAVAFLINVALWNVSGGEVNMFFIGPANSSLAVFKVIAERCGWYVSTLLYIPCVCLGAYLTFLPFKMGRQRLKAMP